MAIYLLRAPLDARSCVGFDSFIVTASSEAEARVAAAAIAPIPGEGPTARWHATVLDADGALDGDDLVVDGRVMVAGEQLRGA